MDPELRVRFVGDDSHLQQTIANIQRQFGDVPRVADRASDSFNRFKKSSSSLNDTLGNLVKGYLTFQAVVQGGRMFIDAAQKVQKYENQLKVASGTQEEYAKSTAFLEGLADKYNKNVLELGASYAKLSIATKGTNLEGKETERLFAAVTAASSALQMSVDDTNGTFQAFIQMVSKGNVQAEELRGQLGERLYGAFNLAAQAMGVSTSQLNKMLEQGQVLASDLLPKLATELEKTFGASAQQNANNLASNIDYATGQATMFFAEFGKTSGITDGLNSMASAMGELFNWLRKLNTESGVVDGFFDRMFTLPGGSLTGFKKGSKSEKPVLGPLDMSKFSGTKTFLSNAQSTTDSNAYGAQFGIRDLNSSAEAKIKRQNELAAAKAQREIDKQVAEWIQESKDRIAEGIFEAEKNAEAAYRKFNSGVSTPGQILPGGTNNVYSMNGGSMTKTGIEFANATTGDGSATNYDHIIAGMTKAVDDAIAQQNRLNNATEDFGERLNKSIEVSLENAIASTAEGVGMLVAGLATGTADLADVGNTFLSIIATLFQQIGDALSTYAATMLIADIAMGSMNPAGALVGAALAYGAAALARSQIQSSGQNAFWTGGIVSGGGGRDRVPAMVSGGEMILNKTQQGNLWGVIEGAYSASNLTGSARANGGDEIHGVLTTRWRSGDMAISAEIGDKRNNYFSGKR